jgi:DNA-binding transcriptional MerR regulator
MTEETGLYPISTLAAQTGVNSVTLRAWERRYGLLKPKRTPTRATASTRNRTSP